MAELLSDKLRKQILESPYEDDIISGLYEKIENMSDSDLREYLWSNRGYYGKTIGAAVNDIPDLKEYTTVKPNFGNKDIDLKKAFNDENILDKFNDLSFEDIDYVARKNGMTGKDLLAQMSKEKIASDRAKIAKGEDKGGWFDSPEAFAHNLGGLALGLFGKRQQEAIERGEEPSIKDIAGDAGEQLLYAMPWGRALRGVKAAKGVGQAIKLGSNAITPLATEAYDAAVYDEDNPRGEFNIGDVATGTITNIAGPEAVKGIAGRIGTRTGKKGIAKKIENYAEGRSKEDVEKALANKNYTAQSKVKGNNTRLKNPVTSQNMTAKDIISGSNYDEAYKDKFDNVRKKLKNKENLTKDELEFAAKDDNLKQLLPGELRKLKTNKQLMTEEAVKNYLTNRAGDKLYQQGKVSIPVVGDYLEKALEDKRKKEEQNRLEKEAEEKWKIKF